jgi:hypothetical protein
VATYLKNQVYQACSKYKQAGREFIKNRISIDERPHAVDDKNRKVIGNRHDYWQWAHW